MRMGEVCTFATRHRREGAPHGRRPRGKALAGRCPPGETSAMTIAPRLSLVTLGVDDIPRSDAFYRALGWEVVLSDGDDFRLFRTAGAWLALYARSSVQRDMGRTLPTGSGSVQLAMNLDSRDDVDA